MNHIVSGCLMILWMVVTVPALAEDICAPKQNASNPTRDLPPQPKEICAGLPTGGTINGIVCPPDRDVDGVADDRDRCPNTPKWVAVDALGCPLDEDQDRVPDYLDRCPGTPPGVKVDAKGCWILKLSIPFEAGKSELKPTPHTQLDRVACLLRQGSAKMEIQGHTDHLASESVYPGLDKRRAQAVANYLIYRGVKPESLIVLGFGATKPAVNPKNAAAQTKNNRVELHPR
ncbi:MAG: OmpA family protein [Magnetococcales bacterium]|nr:OmpA family protein [Magnetococcales bacterium]